MKYFFPISQLINLAMFMIVPRFMLGKEHTSEIIPFLLAVLLLGFFQGIAHEGCRKFS